MDLLAAARRRLGTLGDPADLIFCHVMTIQGAAVGSAAPFVFGRFIVALRKRNNVALPGLMSDRANASTSPAIKRNRNSHS